MFFRSVVLYAFAVVALRLMGKREVGQLQPFELAVVIMIAELAATPMGNVGVPLLYGILPMAALLMCHGFIMFLSMRSPALAKLISGEPTVLIRNGVICEEALRRQGVPLSDLMEALRTGGQMDVEQVGTAVLEPSGRISVFPRATARPATTQELGLKLPEDGLPLPIILDGHVHQGNLRSAGMTEKQLQQVLADMSLGSIADVLLLTRSAQGDFFGQRKGDGRTATQPG